MTNSQKNPETEAIEKALIEKFGAIEYAEARSRAKFKLQMAKTMKDRRIELEMDQKFLAEKLHTTQQQLSRYEVGKNSPTLDKFYDICQALNLEMIIREKEDGKELLHI